MMIIAGQRQPGKSFNSPRISCFNGAGGMKLGHMERPLRTMAHQFKHYRSYWYIAHV
jgi:hypothetical protein